MTALTLRLQKNLENESTTAGAVATLRRVADETGMAVRGGRRQDVTIPANNQGEGKLVPVEPGRWLVEATLPSGEVLSEEVAVPDGSVVPVTLRTAERSPHEWLGWQHLIGNIEGVDTLEKIRERARQQTMAATAEALPKELDQKLVEKISGKAGDLAGGVAAHVARELTPLIRIFRGGTRSGSSYSAEIEEALSVEPEASLESSPSVEPGEPVVGILDELSALPGEQVWKTVLGLDDDSSLRCAPSASSPEERLHLYRFLEPVRPKGHDFAHVAWNGERFAVSLPVPWIHTVRYDRVPVEMMVRLHPLEKTLHIGVAVLDSEFGTLAGLMTASTLQQAKIVVEQAYQLLYDKFSNPLAAAAGGYVLLATGGSETHPEWQGWITNLYRAFPDLPDGAVLEASRRLLYPGNEGSYDAARTILCEAVDRGIPHFSAGVARLLDGLTLFAEDSVEVKEKMTLVQRVAQRLDPSQAFTVIRLGDKAKRA